MCANEIEGAEKLARGGVGFSSDNVEATAAPENGNVKFTVTPKGGLPVISGQCVSRALYCSCIRQCACE